MTLVGIMSAGAAGAAVLGVVQNPHIPGAGIAPAAFVISSARNTANQRTADVVFTGKISEQGRTVPISGTGQASFTQHAFTGNVTLPVSGHSLVEKELQAGGHFYVSVIADGVNVVHALTGKQWVLTPTPVGSNLSDVGVGNVDPLTQLKLDEKQGATVKFLGTAVIAGDTVSKYSVVPSRKEIAAAIQSEVDSGQIPAGEAHQFADEQRALGTFTSILAFDGKGIMRRETVTIGGGTSGAHGSVIMTFRNFGAAIRIAVPGKSSIVSYSAFLKAAQSAASSTQ